VDKDYLFDFDEVKSHLRGTIIRTQKKKKKKKVSVTNLIRESLFYVE
jgi:hypothetical protein